MSKKDPPDAAAIAAQEQRIERSALDFGEDFLAGRASIEIRPLPGNESVSASAGALSLLQGFSISLCPAAK